MKVLWVEELTQDLVLITNTSPRYAGLGPVGANNHNVISQKITSSLPEMCVREGVTAGTTKRSCRCSRNGQRGRRGGRRTGEAQTARCDPQTTPGSCSASAEPPSGQLEGGWTCTSLTHFCRILLLIKIGYGQVGVVQSMCCPDKGSRFTLYEISPL